MIAGDQGGELRQIRAGVQRKVKPESEWARCVDLGSSVRRALGKRMGHAVHRREQARRRHEAGQRVLRTQSRSTSTWITPFQSVGSAGSWPARASQRTDSIGR